MKLIDKLRAIKGFDYEKPEDVVQRQKAPKVSEYDMTNMVKALGVEHHDENGAIVTFGKLKKKKVNYRVKKDAEVFVHPNAMVMHLTDLIGTTPTREVVNHNYERVLEHLAQVTSFLTQEYGDNYRATPMMFFDFLATGPNPGKDAILEMVMKFGYIDQKTNQISIFLELHHTEPFDLPSTKIIIADKVTTQYYKNNLWLDCSLSNQDNLFTRDRNGTRFDITNPHMYQLENLLRNITLSFGNKLLLVGDYLYFDWRWLDKGLFIPEILQHIYIEPLDVSSLAIWNRIEKGGLVDDEPFELRRANECIENTINIINRMLKKPKPTDVALTTSTEKAPYPSANTTVNIGRH